MVLHSSPWLYTYSHCHQMVTKQRPKGHRVSSRVTPKLRSFSHPMVA